MSYRDDLDDNLHEGEVSYLDAPDSLKNLRACIPCKLVKTHSQFQNDGCENCSFFEWENDKDLVLSATTTDFDGFVALMDPSDSWVGKWTRVSQLHSGVYAVRVNKDLPSDLESMLENGGHMNYGKLSKQDNPE